MPPQPSLLAHTPSAGASPPACTDFHAGPGGARGSACRFRHTSQSSQRPCPNDISSASLPEGPSTSHLPQAQASSDTPARPPCLYFDSPSGCWRGSKCRFQHVLSSEPDGRAPTASSGPGPGGSASQPSASSRPKKQGIPCKYYQAGYCAWGDKCWFKHDLSHAPSNCAAGTASSASAEKGRAQGSERPECSICYEIPSTYGLLSSCDHIFCLPCLKQWRAAPRSDMGSSTFHAEDAANKKLCPVCRKVSLFVIPSSHFVTEGKKATVVRQFKASTHKKPCRYFEASKRSRAGVFCPFADDCFYAHVLEESKFEFGMTAQEMLNVRVRRRLLPMRRQEGLRAIGLGDSRYAGDRLARSAGGALGWSPDAVEDYLGLDSSDSSGISDSSFDDSDDEFALAGLPEDADDLMFDGMVHDFEELVIGFNEALTPSELDTVYTAWGEEEYFWEEEDSSF